MWPAPAFLPPPQENFVAFLPKYLRLAAAVLLATFYLRPKALLGAAALALSIFRTLTRALERQAAEAAAAAAGGAGRGAAGAAPADPNEQLVTAGLTVVTWLLVAYTRCVPVLLLGMASSLVAVLVHCGLRRAPSEYRYKGRQPLGFTLRQLLGQGALPGAGGRRAAGGVVVGPRPRVLRGAHLPCRNGRRPPQARSPPLRAEPVPEGCRPAGLFRELALASWQAAAARWQWAKRYARYYLLSAWDAARHPRSLLQPSTSGGLS